MASSSQQLISNDITLRGSTAIVCEFFGYAINSVLYQRAIYAEDTFEAKKRYNLQIMVTKNEALQSYLNSIMQQMQQWLLRGEIKKLVLVIASIDDGTPLERWCFNVETNQEFVDDAAANGGSHARKLSSQHGGKNKTSKKCMKEIQNEIRGIIRQITSSVTFLPLLEVPCSFDILMYTNKQCQIPKEWQQSQPKYINNAEVVRLRSFDTKIHKIDAMVSYRINDDDEDEEDDDQEDQEMLCMAQKVV